MSEIFAAGKINIFQNQVGSRKYFTLQKRFVVVNNAALHVLIKHFFAIFRRRFAVTIVNEHDNAADQVFKHIAFCCNSGRFSTFRLFILFTENFFDSVKNVLNEADLAHILGLEKGKFFRQIIGIHVPVTGNNEAGAVFFLQREEAAPLIFHPHRIEIFRFRSDDQHHFCGIERGKNVRFVLLTQLGFQRDTGKKYFVSRIGQLVINVLRDGGIFRPRAAVGGLFVADKNIKRLFLRGNFQDVFLDLRNACAFAFVNLVFGSSGRVFQCGKIIRIGGKRFILNAMASWDPFAGGGIFHVFDAEPGDGDPPIGFRIGTVVIQNTFVRRDCFIEIPGTAEMLRTVIQIFPPVITDLRKRGQSSAIRTFPRSDPRRQFHHAPAHFALDRSHFFILPSRKNQIILNM